MSVYHHRVSVSRLQATTGIKYAYSAVGGEHFCSIQPMDDVTAVNLGYALSRTYKVYFPDESVDIQISDKITDQDSTEYTVKGVKNYKLSGGTGHTEATVELVD